MLRLPPALACIRGISEATASLPIHLNTASATSRVRWRLCWTATGASGCRRPRALRRRFRHGFGKRARLRSLFGCDPRVVAHLVPILLGIYAGAQARESVRRMPSISLSSWLAPRRPMRDRASRPSGDTIATTPSRLPRSPRHARPVRLGEAGNCFAPATSKPSANSAISRPGLRRRFGASIFLAQGLPVAPTADWRRRDVTLTHPARISVGVVAARGTAGVGVGAVLLRRG